MNVRGLGLDGTIAREGSLDRVAVPFEAVVAAAREGIAARFDGSAGLHSAYLYGSIPRGTAVAGRSDLDLLLALREEPTEADQMAAQGLAAEPDRELSVIDGVGVLLYSVGALLSERERHDLGFFVACLCTPLLGPDLAERLPRYRPTSLLARETNGDLAQLLPRWRERAAGSVADPQFRALTRSVGRKLVRTGFSLVMTRWHGWTSDLVTAAQAFGEYFPARRRQMLLAASVARVPSADPVVLRTLLDELAPWLAEEYAAVHGIKAPRSYQRSHA